MSTTTRGASNSEEIKERSENNNESELEKLQKNLKLLSSVTHSFIKAVVIVGTKCNSRLATKLCHKAELMPYNHRKVFFQLLGNRKNFTRQFPYSRKFFAFLSLWLMWENEIRWMRCLWKVVKEGEGEKG